MENGKLTEKEAELIADFFHIDNPPDWDGYLGYYELPEEVMVIYRKKYSKEREWDDEELWPKPEEYRKQKHRQIDYVALGIMILGIILPLINRWFGLLLIFGMGIMLLNEIFNPYPHENKI